MGITSSHNREEAVFFQTIFQRIFVCLLLMGSSVSLAQSEQYTFAIVPQQAASVLVKNWGPLLQYLSTQSNHEFKFRTGKNIPVFEQGLEKGEYDFAYMNPYHYIIFHQKSGYQAFAKAKNKKIRGIIVVKKDSPYQNLADLNRQKLAFPSPLAFAASMLTRSALVSNNVEFSSQYVSSHDSVYRNVAAGHFAAGGGVVRTFKAAPSELRANLRILYTTQAYTPHAFAVHPRVPEQIIKQVQTILLGLDSNEQGELLLQRLGIQGIEKAEDKQWNDIRQLKLNVN